MPLPDDLSFLALPPPKPLEQLARTLGQRYERLYKSLVRKVQWPDVCLALELQSADFLALAIPGRQGLLGYHLIATARTCLPREQCMVGSAAGEALLAIMRPYVPAPAGLDSKLTPGLRDLLPFRRPEGLELSEGWATLNRAILERPSSVSRRGRIVPETKGAVMGWLSLSN